MIKKILWIISVTLSVIVGLYPVFYYINERFGILKGKPHEVMLNIFYPTAFYIHITLGGLALLIGWVQFSQKIRTKNINLHRQIGKLYVIAVLLSAAAGFYIAFYAMGGTVPALGFISLSIIWFYTTFKGYTSIRKGQLLLHQKMMIYSYAACFAAVTLRLWIPVLSALFGGFEIAYAIVAWWCWIPNLVVAYFLTKELDKKQLVKMPDIVI